MVPWTNGCVACCGGCWRATVKAVLLEVRAASFSATPVSRQTSWLICFTGTRAVSALGRANAGPAAPQPLAYPCLPSSSVQDSRNAVNNVRSSFVCHRRGLEVVTLHGGMEQWERNLAMVKLRLGTLHVLVATDVAARGLDVEHLAFVVHWDLPRDLDTFTHRCGRTGRAGRAGASYILAGPRQAQSLEGWANGEGDEQGHQGTLPDIEWLEADWVPQGFGGDDPFSEVPAPMWRLLIILGGKKDKLSKGDVLGGITGETGFKGKDVGSIEITDTQTYVAVSCDKAEAIWRQLDNARIKKKRRRVHRTWR